MHQKKEKENFREVISMEEYLTKRQKIREKERKKTSSPAGIPSADFSSVDISTKMKTDVTLQAIPSNGLGSAATAGVSAKGRWRSGAFTMKIPQLPSNTIRQIPSYFMQIA